MKHPFWRFCAVGCLILGVATIVSTYMGMLAGLSLTIYLVYRMWFTEHQDTGWYDLLFLGTLMGMVLAGAGVYAGTCPLLSLVDMATPTCRAVRFDRVLRLHLAMCIGVGGPLWLFLRLGRQWKLPRLWPAVAMACAVLGAATTISPGAGLLAGWCIAPFLVYLMLFFDRPLTWLYDLAMLAVLAGTGLVGAGVFVGFCALLPYTGITPLGCKSFGFVDAVRAHLLVLGGLGGVLLLGLRLWLGRRLRQSE